MLFYQRDEYLWPHCCMNNLYISHRSIYAPTHSFWAIHSMLINLSRVTFWFDTVYNFVTRWVNFRKKSSCMDMNYNYPTTIFRSFFAQNLQISGRKIYIYNFCLWTFKGQNEKNVNNTRNTIYLGQNTFKYRSQIIEVYVHANGFF